MDKPTIIEKDLRTRSDHYNQGTKQLQQIHEELNSAMNWKALNDAIKWGKARDINDEPKVDKTPCIIVGSGGSLDEALPIMKDWKGGVICSTSQALTLMYYGIVPSHIMMLDPFCFWEEIQGIDWSKTKTKMITHPGIWPDIIEKWPNEMLLYIQNNGRRDSYYATTQKHMYSKRTGIRDAKFEFLIRTEMTVFACSPAMQMFMAGILGYGKIFLSGCDFGYTYGKDRFTNYTMGPDGWEKHEHPLLDDKTPEWGEKERIMSDNGIPTEKVHMYYKKNMISAWRLSMQEVYTTDKGTITEIQYIPMHKVIKTQGKGFLPPQKEKKRVLRDERAAELYLASVGAYVIKSSHGFSFVESEQPEIDLPKYMEAMRSRLRCKTCGAEGPAPANGKLEGMKCPICGAADVTRPVEVDIAGNMERINWLVKLARPHKA